MDEARQVPAPDSRLWIGKIVKLRGLRGDLKIVPLTWNPDRFLDLEKVWVQLVTGAIQEYSFKRIRVENQFVFVRFREAPLRDLAEPLVGADVFIDVRDRAPLPDTMYYHDDVIGCRVVDANFGDLGIIREILEPPVHDIWQVEGPYGEVLIPVTGEFVTSYHLEEKRIEVELPEGLVDTQPGTDAGRKSPGETAS